MARAPFAARASAPPSIDHRSGTTRQPAPPAAREGVFRRRRAGRFARDAARHSPRMKQLNHDGPAVLGLARNVFRPAPLAASDESGAGRRWRARDDMRDPHRSPRAIRPFYDIYFWDCGELRGGDGFVPPATPLILLAGDASRRRKAIANSSGWGSTTLSATWMADSKRGSRRVSTDTRTRRDDQRARAPPHAACSGAQRLTLVDVRTPSEWRGGHIE